jgi:hypothetical protein
MMTSFFVINYWQYFMRITIGKQPHIGVSNHLLSGVKLQYFQGITGIVTRGIDIMEIMMSR